ncbi:11674_t:CDS:1, partial [Paraglomus brasilianum]
DTIDKRLTCQEFRLDPVIILLMLLCLNCAAQFLATVLLLLAGDGEICHAKASGETHIKAMQYADLAKAEALAETEKLKLNSIILKKKK